MIIIVSDEEIPSEVLYKADFALVIQGGVSKVIKSRDEKPAGEFFELLKWAVYN